MRYSNSFHFFARNMLYRETFVLSIKSDPLIICGKHFHMNSNVSFFLFIVDLLVKLFSKLEVELDLLKNYIQFYFTNFRVI